MNPTLTKSAANLKRRAANRGCDLPSLWILSDEKRLPDPRAALVSMPRGSALILRHYSAQDREALARRLAQLCRQKGVALLIAGDWRLAAQVGAAGVHLPEHAARRGLPPGGRLWLRAARRLLTVAAHTKLGLRRAGDMRASAAVLAPIFPTASHPSHKGLGAMRSAAMIRTARLPVIALGGVTPTTITALRYTGCVGVAGISFALAA